MSARTKHRGRALDLQAALRLVAGVTREWTGADFCSIFLVEGDALRLAVAVRGDGWPEPFGTRRFFVPVPLDSERARAFPLGRTVAVEDARSDPRIPGPLAEEFSLRSMAMVAMHDQGRPCGILTIGRNEVRPFAAEHLVALEAMAAQAARAVSEAQPAGHLERRARVQEALARGAASLSGPLDEAEIAAHLAAAFAEVVPSGVCAVALVDDDRLRISTLAASQPLKHQTPIALADLPADLLETVRAAWTAKADRPTLQMGNHPWVDSMLGAEGSGVTEYLLLPLVVGARAAGAVSLGFVGGIDLDAEERAAIESLLAMGGAVLERQQLLVRLAHQVRQLQTLYHLDADLAEGAGIDALIDRLNSVMAEHGAEVAGVTLRDRALARHFQATPAGGGNGEAADAAQGWSRDEMGSWAVPMHVGRREVGTLRVRAGDLDAPQRAFLEALGNGLAEAANRAALRAAVEEAARERAVAAEREHFAADLHDSAGQMLVAVSMLASRLADELPTGSAWAGQAQRLAQRAEEGKRAIEDAVRALRFVPASRRGLVRSLRALTRSLAADSGLEIGVNVSGRPLRQRSAVERALFRVGHEALANAWRHAQCRTITVDLEFTGDGIRLRIADDGIGINGDGRAPGMHMGLVNMRRAMSEVGGKLKVRNRPEGGVLVEAKVVRDGA